MNIRFRQGFLFPVFPGVPRLAEPDFPGNYFLFGTFIRTEDFPLEVGEEMTSFKRMSSLLYILGC